MSYLVSVIKKYGKSVQIGDDTIKAMIQPLRRRNIFYNKTRIPLDNLNGYMLYIGYPNYPLSEKQTINVGGKEYTVIVTEPYMNKDVCCYIWAILKEKSLCR